MRRVVVRRDGQNVSDVGQLLPLVRNEPTRRATRPRAHSAQSRFAGQLTPRLSFPPPENIKYNMYV